jgi:hypothetical protein
MKNKILNTLFTIFLCLTFIAGIYVIYTDKIKIVYEPMTQILPTYCPDTLGQREDGRIILFNSDSPSDYITFLNMDDYNDYVDKRKKMGVECPDLELKQIVTSDYGTIKNPAHTIDAGSEENQYNGSGYPSFDPYGLQIGVYNNLDKIHDSPVSFSETTRDIYGSKWDDVETKASGAMNNRFT